jgi:protein-tyrosine phosphatase
LLFSLPISLKEKFEDTVTKGVIINCAHGKDRTGILSALVLSVLGETEENIIKDYTLSQVYYRKLQNT